MSNQIKCQSINVIIDSLHHLGCSDWLALGSCRYFQWFSFYDSLNCFSSCSVPDYYELHEVSTVLHGTDTDMRLEVMLERGSEDSQAEKERVLLSLLNTKHFTEARKFVELVKLSGDLITRKEVRRTVIIEQNTTTTLTTTTV